MKDIERMLSIRITSEEKNPSQGTINLNEISNGNIVSILNQWRRSNEFYFVGVT